MGNPKAIIRNPQNSVYTIIIITNPQNSIAKAFKKLFRIHRSARVLQYTTLTTVKGFL